MSDVLMSNIRNPPPRNILMLFFTTCLCFLLYTDGCESLQLRSIQSPVTPLLGNNTLTLTCEYTKEATDTVITFTLKRRSLGQNLYDTIVTYIVNGKSVIYGSVANIESRTTANFTDVGEYPFLQFSSIVSDDKADYMWECSYLDFIEVAANNVTFSVKVRAQTNFPTVNEPITISPEPPVLEGDIVTFECKGDVGDEPSGNLSWFYYLKDSISAGIDISAKAVSTAPLANSKQRVSVLQLNMTRALNLVVVRCTVQQDHFDEFGEAFRQTDQITVLYGPAVPSITIDLPRQGFTVGESVTLHCSADANPRAQLYWRLPDNRLVMDSSVTLTDLSQNHIGEYLCVAHNEIKGTNYTRSNSINLNVNLPAGPVIG